MFGLDTRTTNRLNARRNLNQNGDSKAFKVMFALVGAFVALVFVVVIGSVVFQGVNATSAPVSSTSCEVTGKDRASDGQGGSSMRVYTTNCGTFGVQDNLFVGQLNSADVYGSIQEGRTYDFQTVGKRIPLMSMFPNIVSVTEVQ